MPLIDRVARLGALVTALLAGVSAIGADPARAEVVQRFHSAPGLHPPRVGVQADPDPGAGDILLAPEHSSQRGPMILDPGGRLVWFHPVPGGLVFNLQKQTYDGRPVLTWWQERTVSGRPRPPEDVIVDSAYRTVAVLHASPGDTTDAHEFQITSHNTALIAAWAFVPADLRSVGGPENGRAEDDIVEELDIRTGRILWQWHSVGHVPLADSHAHLGRGPYDYFHLNSIQQLPGGNLLVSARNTWSVYKINRRTGRVMWTLGGRHSSFTMGHAAHFEWQHDARLHGRRLSLFDDGANASVHEEQESSAELLRLDTHSMSATLVRRIVHRPPVLSGTEGNVQTLPDGNLFVGWGSQPYFSEYTPQGRQIFDGHLPLGVDSYRAFRFGWRAQPSYPPALAVSRSSRGTVNLYVSWNGATQVAAWRVLGGPSPQTLQPVARVARAGFETRVRLRSSRRYFEVEALDARGHVLGRSAARPG